MSSTLDSAQHRADPASPARTRPRLLGRRGVAIALVVATVVVAVAVGTALWIARGPAEAPYADPASTGRLTLCGADGSALTEGSTSDRPLAAAVAGADGIAGAAGGSAALFAYQPQEGVAPSEWTGLQLTAATPYDDAAAPQAALGEGDTTLSQFLAGYPATYDGWVQLRLYLSAPDAAVDNQHYSSVDLHVDGTTWTAADPGAAHCSATTP